MAEHLPSLAGADWLQSRPVRAVFDLLLAAGEEARVIGGVVRNALMEVPVGDFDFATTATPGVVTELAHKAGIKAVPTGIEQGTVTLVVEGVPVQVTTLREDIATDGRRAVVRFGRDWKADAQRRDFTVNALSVDVDGKVYDPIGGYPDIAARRIRFIGDPARRIAEDRLRILRLFRLNAEYGRGEIDAVGLEAAIAARAGLRELSAERIGQEMRRLVVAPRAAETVVTMQEAGILGVVLAGVGYLPQFTRLASFEEQAGVARAAAPRLGVLACRIEEDVLRIADRLRLSNAERDRIAAMLAAAENMSALPSEREGRRLIYMHGAEAVRDATAYRAALTGQQIDGWQRLLNLGQSWSPPKFPLGGKELIAAGVRGPAIGQLLDSVETWWIEQDFAPDETALRARLQQAIAAAQ